MTPSPLEKWREKWTFGENGEEEKLWSVASYPNGQAVTPTAPLGAYRL